MRKDRRASRSALKRTLAGGTVLALAALFGLPTAALAGDPTVVNFSLDGTTVTVQASPGEANVITIAGSTTITFKDTGSDNVDPGTNAATHGCVQTANPNQVNCPIGEILTITVNGDDLDDRITFLTSAAAMTANGDNGDDTLLGGNGNDDLNGGNGDDRLRGGNGQDDFDGGANTDVGDTVDYSGSLAAHVTLDAGVDDDGRDIDAGTIGIQPEGDDVVNVENVQGGNGDDDFTGNASNNFLDGGGGDDLLDGAGGNDTLEGGDGDDDFVGGAGGSDIVTYGLESQDVTVTVDNVANDGPAGELDNIHTDVETVIGGVGDDNLTGGAGTQTLRGGAGNDTLNGGPGITVDNLFGGTGIDTVSYAGRVNDVTISLDGVANDGEAGENDNVDDDIENALGGNGDDTITGSDARNRLNGGLGADTVNGGGGNDTLVGLIDGSGDTYNGGSGTDTVTFASAAAGVTIEADGAAAGNTEGEVVGTSVENIVGSDFNDTLTGNASRNTLSGGFGNDTLNGEGGNDTLNGQEGDDTLNGGDGNDALNGGNGPGVDPDLGAFTDADTLNGNANIDTVSYSTRTANLTLRIDGLANDGQAGEGDDIGATVEKITGGKGNDTIVGDSSNETLTGGPGDDTINGASGADTISGQGGDDTLTGGGGKDGLSGGPGADVFHTVDGVKDSINCGTGTDNVADTDAIDAKASNCFP